MLIRLFLSIFIVPLSLYGQEQISVLKEKAKNNSNPMKWDLEMFKNDLDNTADEFYGPFKDMAYPVEAYKYAVASTVVNFKIDESCFSGLSFGERIPKYSGVTQTDYRVTILIHTGQQYEKVKNMVISRNAPYLSFQGKLEPIQFAGVYSPDNTGFLIVNMKVFDLRFGKTIVIFPSTSNSFKYLQLEIGHLSPDNSEKYISELKTNAQLNSFLKKFCQ